MTSPIEQAAPRLGARALELARAELARGVREEPPGSNRGPDIDRYLSGCVRGGKRLGVLGVPWCAAFASRCIWEAWLNRAAPQEPPPVRWNAATRAPDAPPVGYRAAVAEFVIDALATGALRLPQSAEEPRPGDLLIYGRDGHSPLRGEPGHVTICAEWGERKASIGGNELDSVAEVDLGPSGEHPRCGPLLAWVRI